MKYVLWNIIDYLPRCFSRQKYSHLWLDRFSTVTWNFGLFFQEFLEQIKYISLNGPLICLDVNLLCPYFFSKANFFRVGNTKIVFVFLTQTRRRLVSCVLQLMNSWNLNSVDNAGLSAVAIHALMCSAVCMLWNLWHNGLKSLMIEHTLFYAPAQFNKRLFCTALGSIKVQLF